VTKNKQQPGADNELQKEKLQGSKRRRNKTPNQKEKLKKETKNNKVWQS